MDGSKICVETLTLLDDGPVAGVDQGRIADGVACWERLAFRKEHKCGRFLHVAVAPVVEADVDEVVDVVLMVVLGVVLGVVSGVLLSVVLVVVAWVVFGGQV